MDARSWRDTMYWRAITGSMTLNILTLARSRYPTNVSADFTNGTCSSGSASRLADLGEAYDSAVASCLRDVDRISHSDFVRKIAAQNRFAPRVPWP
jgi:hypothetical protein